MLNILNAFENIEVKNENRISNEDLEIIKKYQKDFDNFKNTFLQYEKFYIDNPLDAPVYRGDYNYNDTKSCKMLEKLYENFMKDAYIFSNSIYRYFKDKYNIELENRFNKGTEYCVEYRKEESEKRLNFYKNELNYNLILDDIFIQLDGFDFNSKAEQELKSSFKGIFLFPTKNYSDLKNKKVSISSFFYIDSFDKKWGRDKVSYNSRDRFNILDKVLTCFEYGTVKNSLNATMDKILNNDGDIVFTKHELIFDKIDSIKLYKNGKLDINFKSTEYARIFAKEYCDLDV